MSGCGTVIAGMIVGEIGDINRFHSPGALVSMQAVLRENVPVEKKHRHLKTASGNRNKLCFHRDSIVTDITFWE